MTLVPSSHQLPNCLSVAQANKEHAVAYFFPGRELALATLAVPDKSQQDAKARLNEQEEVSAPVPLPVSVAPPVRPPETALPQVPRS
jgi:hypothetical protein